MAQITTKSGDTGMTQLAPGKMSSKTHPGIVLRGEIDELSCVLGMEGDRFDHVQSFLTELMGFLYFDTIDEKRLTEQVIYLEDYITSHNNSIPPLFVNARGAVSLARAVCRRVERQIVALVESEREKPAEDRCMNMEPIIRYFNRLSDYLFVKSFERVVEPSLFRDELANPDLLKAVA